MVVVRARVEVGKEELAREEAKLVVARVAVVLLVGGRKIAEEETTGVGVAALPEALA